MATEKTKRKKQKITRGNWREIFCRVEYMPVIIYSLLMKKKVPFSSASPEIFPNLGF
jgi:hypothetical protein